MKRDSVSRPDCGRMKAVFIRYQIIPEQMKYNSGQNASPSTARYLLA